MGYIIIIKYSLSSWLTDCPQHTAEQQQPTWVLLYTGWWKWNIRWRSGIQRQDLHNIHQAFKCWHVCKWSGHDSTSL